MTTVGAIRARVVLSEARALGVDLSDLLAAADAHHRAATTLAEFVATIEPTFTPGTAATYRPYWRLAIDRHGDRRLGELTLIELHAVVEAAAERARRTRPDSGGRSSRESCVAALRALFGRAVAAGLVPPNPAASLTKPRRSRPRRRALDDTEQAQLIDAIRATSSDPALHLLLVRFHLETGARRSGALALARDDVDDRRATVWLTEKDTTREQPVSPSLVRQLLDHDARRGGLFVRRTGVRSPPATTTSSSGGRGPS